mgnify:CR=1 FL=1|tara:strand:- start:897 stop:1145 length:249 start_codon:yes stop_codon:yes gene_type:complete
MTNKPVKQIQKEYNIIINTTEKMLKSLDQFIDFDILAIVNGVLYAVFNMVYTLAPSCDVALETIENALENFHNQNHKPKAEA